MTFVCAGEELLSYMRNLARAAAILDLHHQDPPLAISRDKVSLPGVVAWRFDLHYWLIEQFSEQAMEAMACLTLDSRSTALH